MSHFDQKIESDRTWKKIDEWKDGKSTWALRTKDGKTWSGTVSVQIIPGESHKYTVIVSVAQAG